jgi:signal transduction histidine kinase
MLQDLLQHSPYCQELYQTEAQEIWDRAIAVIAQLLPAHPGGILLTHNPKILEPQHHLLQQVWVFAPNQSALLVAPLHNLEIVLLPEQLSFEHEAFAILLAPNLQILLLATEPSSSFWFSFHPQPIDQAIASLQNAIPNSSQRTKLQQQIQAFDLSNSTYNSIAKFTAILFTQTTPQELPIPEIKEVEILRALTHEVKTPLTVISTLVKSLLRRKDVMWQVRERLEQIELECKTQIERFHLIFEAIDLPHSQLPMAMIDISQILAELLPHWQEQAKRQQLSIALAPSAEMPAIASNAKILKLLLNGIADRLIRNLPSGSHIQLEVLIVGDHLKLQFQSQIASQVTSGFLVTESPLLRAVGQWLMLQPETGRVSLSLSIAKTLFRALHGKLTVRLHPHSTAYDGEILTIFLPLA